MPRYAIGDVQGCHDALQTLLRKLRFSPDRDQLWLVGDLVNRGPQSLEVLRFVRSLGAAAQTVLGNHDLHLLALHHDPQRELRAGDTVQDILAAPDRGALLDWLIQQPLIIEDAARGDVLVHAGLLPLWSVATANANAAAALNALRANPPAFLAQMYGNQPDHWDDAVTDIQRHRFTINVLTRLRYCQADGRIDLKQKGAPASAKGTLRPWFEHAQHERKDQRVIFGHWSTLGLVQRADLLALDTGCVWGGALTAVNLDDRETRPVQVPCEACQPPGME